jgi:BirA family biotin operon repressor/biotin-[acetyl-CoA-carboxylase] ligase
MRSGVRKAYRDNCHSIGQSITAILPGDAMLVGTAADIDMDGRLLVATADGVHPVAAGDVYHVR